MPLVSMYHAVNSTSFVTPPPPSTDFSNSFYFTLFFCLFALIVIILLFVVIYAFAQPDLPTQSDYGSDEESLWTWSEGEDSDISDMELPPPYHELYGFVFGLARGELRLALEEPPPSYEVVRAEAAGEAVFGAPFPQVGT